MGIVLGYALLLRIAAAPAWVAVLLPTTLLVGARIGVAFQPLNIQAITRIAAHEHGIAGAIFQASNQIGAAVVLAAVTAVVTSNGGASTQVRDDARRLPRRPARRLGGSRGRPPGCTVRAGLAACRR